MAPVEIDDRAPELYPSLPISRSSSIAEGTSSIEGSDVDTDHSGSVQLDKPAKKDKMERWPVPLLLVYFCTPSLISMMIQSMYTVGDVMIVGHGRDGPNAMAGVSLYYPIEALVMAFSMALGLGLNSVMSIAMGRGQTERASHAMGNALLLTAACGVLFPLFSFFALNWFFDSTGGTSETLTHALRYGQILLPAVGIQATYSVFDNIWRADGKPLVAMTLMISSCATNIIIDLILILGFDMATVGCAIATVTAVSWPVAVAVIYYGSIKKDGIRLTRACFIPDWDIMKTIISSGIGMFIAELGFAAIALIKNFFIEQLVPEADAPAYLAAAHAVERMTMLSLVSIIAIANGQIPISGYSYGAGLYRRLTQIYFVTLSLTTVCSICAFLLMVGFPQLFLYIFTTDETVVSVGVPLSRLEGAGLVVVGFVFTTMTFFLATNQAWFNTVGMAIRQLLLNLPLMILGGLVGKNFLWVQAATPVTDYISTVIQFFIASVALYRMIREARRRRRADQVGSGGDGSPKEL